MTSSKPRMSRPLSYLCRRLRRRPGAIAHEDARATSLRLMIAHQNVEIDELGVIAAIIP